MPLLRPELATPAGLALAASAYAAAELLLVLTLGRFFDWGRAEALLFFAWRPWLILALAAMASKLGWQRRLILYASSLILAALCESILLLRLGASDPWPEMLRGLAAGAMLLVPVDLLIQAGRRLRGRVGVAVAGAALLLLLLVPTIRRPYDSIAIGPGDSAPAGKKPALLLLTSLPIVWGEGGAFDPASRPASSYRALQEEYDVRPIDVADEANLRRGGLLLVAQPRWLAPAELAVLDTWVRSGGKIVILTDPALVWPSELPLTDVRRPAPVSLLGPLLTHWGLRLEPARQAGISDIQVAWPQKRRLVMDSPGRFVAPGNECRVLEPNYLAGCLLDKGAALLVADADLLNDARWTAPGEPGDARHVRLADNPLFVADLLDELAGLERDRARRPVAWADPSAGRGAAVLLAMLPAILVACAGLLLARIRKTKPQTYPQDYKG